MSRDELATLLRSLDRAPVEERPQLQRELGERLVAELGRPRWRDRFEIPQVRVRLRRAGLAVAVAAGAAAIAVGAWVAAGALRTTPAPVVDEPTTTETPTTPTLPSSALGTLLEARTRWLNSPRPTHAAGLTSWDGGSEGQATTTWEVWVRDASAWRRTSTTESTGASPSAYTYVWDGRRELTLVDRADTVPSVPRAQAPTAETFTYVQTGRHPFGTPLQDWLGSTYGWERRCATGEVLADAEVAGRPAHHLRCAGEQLWLDTETGLLLRHERGADVDDLDPGAMTYEVTAVEYDRAFAPDRFDTQPPDGLPVTAFSESPHPLAPGQDAPPFEATTADGQSVRLEELRGDHVLVVFWSPGLYDLGVVEQIHRSGRDGLRIVVYDDDLAEQVQRDAAYVADRGYTVPVVFDVEPRTPTGGLAPIARAWRWPDGLPESPGETSLAQFWVLVGPDGRIVATRSGNLLPEELDTWLTVNGVGR